MRITLRRKPRPARHAHDWKCVRAEIGDVTSARGNQAHMIGPWTFA